ncbi:hypothetical protein [Reyranella sp. CPCC 100927]|uniref:hypothetical protein n=1 Tax=Reyranella sp. CPCC 100927 TaxID=2599616 RepID=UPI0011B57C00|nr:hypothetical protein [Reyranella sp. CPCC 100927]TWT12539.1 hypothetical protein FQU96_09700 [Reyranella sp. CPCC 100927]
MKEQNATRRRAVWLARAAGVAVILFAATSQASAQAVKSCEALGGKPPPHKPNACYLNPGPAPFDVSFTGRFGKTDAFPGLGAVFKITSRFDRPVKFLRVQGYAYDKDGKQVDFTFLSQKKKFTGHEGLTLKFEIAPGETKEFVLNVNRESIDPGMDTMEIEILWWSTLDGTTEFARWSDQVSTRPRGGMKRGS